MGAQGLGEKISEGKQESIYDFSIDIDLIFSVSEMSYENP